MTRLGVCLLLALPLTAQDRAIDTERSTITIHVGKAGLFSAAGHEHWVDAPISAGVVDESAPRAEFTVETAKMRVRPDPKVDAKTQVQIQKDMEDMTLDIAHYREIKFQSSRVEKTGDASWRVTGTLSLHGVSKPVAVEVSREGGAFSGKTILKQTDFGIKPISVGGGAIKVKNEIDIEFKIFLRGA
ncbi:MAG TPA: YceI family protein [Bryobacteraceae bacterium]|nr:YceI family protein [Bryobacteraceae bacterium]